MQIINFINHFFLVSMQRSRKLYTMGNLSMAGYTDLKCWYQIEKTFGIYLHAESQLHAFLETLQRYYKLVILGTLGMPGYAHPTWYYQLAENVCAYLQSKNQLHPHTFLEILQWYANFLFWVLWACQTTHSQNDNINL